MTTLPALSLAAARNLALAAQGLLNPPTQPAEKPDLLAVIRRIHALQIDTINIVARAPYHILWSRLGAYQSAWLDELHAEGALFEYWAHAACFLPIEDYPLYRRKMLDDRHGWTRINEWAEKNRDMLTMIRAHLQDNGGVKSSDFKGQKKGATWWDWKVEKMALEYLYFKGEVMIARREKFQRVYDLRERVLPGWDDAQVPTHESVMRRQVLDAVKALGLAREDWVAPYFYLPKLETQDLLHQLLAEGEIFQAEVQGLNDKPFYIHADNRSSFEAAMAGGLDATCTTILSPFDPLVTDRSRLKALFDFDYTDRMLYAGSQTGVWLLHPAHSAARTHHWSPGCQSLAQRNAP